MSKLKIDIATGKLITVNNTAGETSPETTKELQMSILDSILICYDQTIEGCPVSEVLTDDKSVIFEMVQES